LSNTAVARAVMAELMSVQVHVPLMKVGSFADNGVVADSSGAKMETLWKVENDGRSLYQPRKQTVDIEFKDLTYSVSEGRQKGTYRTNMFGHLLIKGHFT